MEKGKTRGSLKPAAKPLAAQEGNDTGHLCSSRSQAGPTRMSCKQGLHCDLRQSTQASNVAPRSSHPHTLSSFQKILLGHKSLPYLSLGVMNKWDISNRPKK